MPLPLDSVRVLDLAIDFRNPKGLEVLRLLAEAGAVGV
jgi:hypothetical protein